MKLIAFIIILFAITGCKKDFLDVKDNTILNKQTSIHDLKTMGQFVNGMHLLVSRDYAKSFLAAYPEVAADNLKPNTARTPTQLLSHYKWVQRAEEASAGSSSIAAESLNTEWRNGYLDIRTCNFVLENIQKYRNENPVLADEYKGQALALRALVAHKLVNQFAQTYTFTSNASHPGIPYITTSDITAPYTRNTVAEVYEYLIKDLTEAITLLPEDYDPRYMNKMAAKALLSRIFLYKGDYINAQKNALEVTARVPLMSIDAGYPDGISKFFQSNQTEVLYQLTPGVIEAQQTTIITEFLSQQMRTSRFFATMDIVNILNEDPNDKRSAWVTPSGANYRVFKYPTAVAGLHTVNPTSDYYHPVLRSSELFLTVAETAFHTGNENMARDYLNSIRVRSNPAIAPVIATGTALMDSIYKERRKELAFEGTRMYDIQRWHLPVKRNDALFPSSMELPYPSNKAIAPIPLIDIQMARLTQNQDY